MSKFMKKAFAVAMTFALVLCMSVSAFAEEGDSSGAATLTDQNTVTITKVYKLNGAGSSPAETFTLEQDGAGKVIDGDTTIDVPNLGTITGATFAEGAAKADGSAKANITIALPTYDKVGVYEYTLKEVAGTTAGVAYYGSDIRLVVTVVNGENGKLRIAGVHTETIGAEKSDSFENTYSANDLSITKTVTGNLGDKSKYFEFLVTLTGVEGKKYAGSYTVEGGSNDSNPKTVKVDEQATFYLKDNETITIKGLPEGVQYVVSEIDYTDVGYTTTKTGDTGTISATAASTVAFTNDKSGTIDTGVILHSAPYVLVLAGVAAAGVVFAVTKKRRAE